MRALVHTTQKLDRPESPQAVCPEDVDRPIATRGSLHGKRSTLKLLLAIGIRLARRIPIQLINLQVPQTVNDQRSVWGCARKNAGGSPADPPDHPGSTRVIRPLVRITPFKNDRCVLCAKRNSWTCASRQTENHPDPPGSPRGTTHQARINTPAPTNPCRSALDA